MFNENIKKYSKDRKVRLWKIAEILKITDSTFSRRLRYELSDVEKKIIYNIINQIAEVEK